MSQQRTNRRGARNGEYWSSRRAGHSDGTMGNSSLDCDPMAERKRVAKRILEAMNPDLAPSKVETFANMSPEKRAEMEWLYGKAKP